MTHRVIRPGDGPAAEPQRGELPDRSSGTFSFLVRARVREATQDTHKLVVERMRSAAQMGVQGHAASKSGLAAEIRALASAEHHAATQHGPAKIASMVYVRHAYLCIAASSILLAERATRPAEELQRGVRAAPGKGRTSGAARYRPLNFNVSEDAVA